MHSTTDRASDIHPPWSWLACLEGQQDMDQPSLGDKSCTKPWKGLQDVEESAQLKNVAHAGISLTSSPIFSSSQ